MNDLNNTLKSTEIKLFGRKIICENTILLKFRYNKDEYKFFAGQYAHFTTTDSTYKDIKGNSRIFSFANSPLISNEIHVAARLGNSKFIRHLNSLPFESVFYISQPEGGIPVTEITGNKLIFIAGGTGIAPARSIIEDKILKNEKKDIHLFYSNKTELQTAFLDDFLKWEKNNEHFQFIPLINEVKNKHGKFEYGEINSMLLEKYLADLNGKFYFLYGPDEFVSKIKDELFETGIKNEKIFTEKFK